MAIWTVWENARLGEPLQRERARFVRDGFSWLAFIFAPLWLLANRMWLVFIAFMALAAALGAGVERLAGEDIAGLATFGFALWFGFEARALKRWALARRGWDLVAVVEADRLIEAERRYFAARAEGDAAEPPTPRPAPWTPKPVPAVVGVLPEATR